MTTNDIVPILPGRRAGAPVHPDDAESAGVQWEPWASTYVSVCSHGAVPAPPSTDRLHHGNHRPANAASVWGTSLQLDTLILHLHHPPHRSL